MPDWLVAFGAHPVVHDALKGALAAAAVDIAAFRSWKTWSDAATYSWSTASFRWFQGAVVGAVVGLGILAVS